MSYDVEPLGKWHRIKCRMVWRRLIDPTWRDPLQDRQDQLAAFFKKNLPIVLAVNCNSKAYYYTYFRHEQDALMFRLKFGDLIYHERV